MRRLAAPALLLLALAAPAEAVFEEEMRSANLDDDPDRETAKTVRVTQRGQERTALNIDDPCTAGGAGYSRRVTGVEDSLARLSLPRADTRDGREVFVELRSGASGRSGESHVVAWRRPEGEVCGVPRQLFEYDTEDRHRRPRGASFLANFNTRVRNASRRYAGLEVVLEEFWARRGEGSCCPSIKRTISYRYDSRRDRYVVYGSRTSEL